MTARWQPQRGEVVLVRFPFVDTSGQPQAKVRPAVVISGPTIHRATADVLVAAISSRPISQPLPTDYEIAVGTAEHRAAGLKKTSWVKTSNLANVPRSAVVRRLGRLPQIALDELDKRLQMALEFGREPEASTIVAVRAGRTLHLLEDLDVPERELLKLSVEVVAQGENEIYSPPSVYHDYYTYLKPQLQREGLLP